MTTRAKKPLPERHPESKAGSVLLGTAGLFAVGLAAAGSPFWLLLAVACWTVAIVALP